MPELVLPEGKLVRTSSGGTDALKDTLVDLKRYAFTGYVKTVLESRGSASTGYVLVVEGNPEIALHAAKGKVAEGKVALKSVWQDSYSETCALEIHAKVDIDPIRAQYPNAVLERTKRVARAPAAKAEKARARPVPPDVVGKLAEWRASDYDVSRLEEEVQGGGPEADLALDAFAGAVSRMEPLRRELAA
ncbi:MAG: hypothetical protein AABY30_05635, partial [Candidatus Thermoplasmatota archaeon]